MYTYILVHYYVHRTVYHFSQNLELIFFCILQDEPGLQLTEEEIAGEFKRYLYFVCLNFR